MLKAVRQFKYLGGIMSYYEYDTSAVRRNIKKARRTSGQFRKVLKNKEVSPRVASMFYQVVIASVLLCGSESWAVSPAVMQKLEGFQVDVVQRLTGMHPRKVKGK